MLSDSTESVSLTSCSLFTFCILVTHLAPDKLWNRYSAKANGNKPEIYC